MGRPRKPVELKKYEGTYRKDRDAAAEVQQKKIKETALILDATSVSCPKTITDKYCKAYWKKLTQGLLSIGVLSAADIPQIEQLCVCLQKLREVQQVFLETSPFDKDYDDIQKRWIALSNKFDLLGAKYYISPAARSKLKLEDLNIQKAEQDLSKNQNAIEKLLSVKR